MKDDDVLHYQANFSSLDNKDPVLKMYQDLYPEEIETPQRSGLETLIRMCQKGIDNLISSIRLSMIED